jgi:hypothetical protein
MFGVVISVLFISSVFQSCSKDKEKSDDTSEFIEATINGQTYHQVDEADDGGFEVNIYYNNIEKNGFCNYIQTIQTSNFELDASLVSFANSVDFKTAKTGNYGVVSKNGYASSFNNFDLYLTYSTNLTTNYTLVSGVNNVTSINYLSSTDTNDIYFVYGNFTCSFKNTKTNEVVPITGKYQVKLYVLK